MKKATIFLVSTIFITTVTAAPPKTCPANGKLKIFILSGQSNMVGFGQLAGSPGTMETYLKSNPKDYGHLVDDNTCPTSRQYTTISKVSF